MKYVRLPHYEFVHVIGPDARKFLQGQVTCNMEQVQDSVSLSGALCNLKGRVIADFRAIAVADGIMLQTQPTMAQRVADVLKKYAVFSKVTISNNSLNGAVLGCFGDDTSEQLSTLFDWQDPGSGNVFKSPDVLVVSLRDKAQRVEIYPLSQTASTAIAKLNDCGEESSISLWDRLDIEAGIFHVDAQFSEEFTPQLLNYDISGVIDFKKGCYTGQEIVARMFYRSTAKKRLTALSSPEPVAVGSSIDYTENGNVFSAPVLRASNATSLTEPACVLLAIIGTHAAQSPEPPTLTNNPQTSLQILPMPYTELKD
jgi:folate-binding protein YgfZ